MSLYADPGEALRDRTNDCPVCSGTGRDPDDLMRDCPECGGSGKAKDSTG